MGFFVKGELGMKAKLTVLSVGLAMLFLAAGCGDKIPTLADVNDSNIKRVHSIYKIYQKANNYAGPENQDEMTKFVNEDATAKVLVERMNLDVSDLSGIFVSERDGQPFKIKWGVQGIQDHPIIFEAEGFEGKRLVAFHKVKELDASEAEKLWNQEIKEEDPGDMMGGVEDMMQSGGNIPGQ